MQPDVPPPNWATWCELMERSHRSAAGKLAGVWALNVLEETLGPHWPEDLLESTGSVPSVVFGYAYAYEFARLLELALRLTILRSTPGYGAVRRDLRRDHRHERRHHSTIQLEVAALAARLGLDPSMEVATIAGGPADVLFNAPNGPIVAEARVVLRDASSRAAEADWERFTAALLILEANHRTTFGGGLDFIPTDRELDELLAGLDEVARQVSSDGEPRTFRNQAGVIEVVPDSRASEVTLRGPRQASNGWPRIASVLREKAAQALRTNATWLRVDVLDGLWQLTEWSRSGLAEKTERLSSAVSEVLVSSGLNGAILTSGAALVVDAVQEITFDVADGAIGLRRVVQPIRARETVIIPLRRDAKWQAGVWRDLYESEPDWLRWALAECGLPSLDEVTAWELD
jgi:hypothetical protein